MKKIFLLALASLLLAAACGNRLGDVNRNTKAATPQASKSVLSGMETNYATPLYVGDNKILVEVADTVNRRELGLSNRSPLTDGQGMLFKFNAKINPGFWMKDMKFNLDFIWVADGKIIGITPDVQAPKSASEKLQIYYPPSMVDEVLEVNAGWSKKNNIKTGNEVRLENYSN